MNRVCLRALTFAALILTPAVAAFPQSLADTAKKEQARRKKVPPKAAAKVYTDSDLPGSGKGTAAQSEHNTAAGQALVPGASALPAGKTGSAAPATDAREELAEIYKARIASLQEEIAESDKEVQQLARHPTGGGKICLIPEGVYQPGKTAPSEIVCPYQMESRYDRARREHDKLKAELAALQEEARRAGVVIR